MTTNHLIIIATVLIGQLILAYQLNSWRSLIEMLVLDCALVAFYFIAILALA